MEPLARGTGLSKDAGSHKNERERRTFWLPGNSLLYCCCRWRKILNTCLLGCHLQMRVEDLKNRDVAEAENETTKEIEEDEPIGSGPLEKRKAAESKLTERVQSPFVDDAGVDLLPQPRNIATDQAQLEVDSIWKPNNPTKKTQSMEQASEKNCNITANCS